MTRKRVNRRVAAILTAALTLGVAGPAVARPIDSGRPSASNAAQPAGDPAVPTQSGSSSDLEYLLIGGVAVVISGAAVATRRRRHTRMTTRPKVAA